MKSLVDIINGYEFDSFRVEMMRDFVSLLYKLSNSIKLSPVYYYMEKRIVKKVWTTNQNRKFGRNW